MIWILSALVIFLFWAVIHIESRLVKTNNRLLALEYKILLPKIEEYAQLKNTCYGRSYDYEPLVEFGSRYRGDKVEILKFEELEPALEKLKATIERACPKKCTKKKVK